MSRLFKRIALPLLCAALLAACGGGINGTYAGNLVSLTFHSGKVEAQMMGQTIAMDYRVDGDKIVLKSPQGDVVITRQSDGSLDTPWGALRPEP